MPSGYYVPSEAQVRELYWVVDLSRRLPRVPGARPKSCLACEHLRALTAIQTKLTSDTSI